MLGVSRERKERRGRVEMLYESPSVVDYYNEYVRGLSGKFRERELTENNTVICPLHDDHDPSLGVLNPGKGNEKFHCFGCGKTGDLVDLHKRVEKIWKHRDISREEARKELESLFGVDVGCEGGGGNNENVSALNAKIDRASKEYGFGDFQRGLAVAKGRPVSRGMLMVQREWMSMMLAKKAVEV